MRHLTFQVKLGPMGKTPAELLAAKSARPQGSAGPFAEVLQGAGRPAGHAGVEPPRHRDPGREREHKPYEDPADPRVRHAAQLGPPPGLAQVVAPGGTPATTAVEAQARTSLEDLLPALVRRVAWSGDGRRGTVRLELGSGRLAGAELVVHADDGRVRVQLRAPPGVDLGPLRERIAARLANRGLSLEDIE